MTREEVINKACSYIKDTPYPNPNQFTKWFLGYDWACAWCGIFVDYIIKHDLGSNILDDCTNFAYVPTIVDWAKQKGYWSNKGKKGDLVIYNWNPENKDGLSHVGIVCDITNTTVTSVDGNTVNDNYDHDCVAKRVRNLKYVVGYVNLPYEEVSMDYNIGDKVIINGNLYRTAYDVNPAGKVENKVTYITRKVNAPHPYNTTNDLGWMDSKDIKHYEEPEKDYKKLYEEELLINQKLSSENIKLIEDINKIKDIVNKY